MGEENKEPTSAEETTWQKERREALKREEDAHNARMRDIEDVIRHRAAIEATDKERTEALKLEFANVQAHRAKVIELNEKSLVVNERTAAALEQLAKLLTEEVKKNNR